MKGSPHAFFAKRIPAGGKEGTVTTDLCEICEKTIHDPLHLILYETVDHPRHYNLGDIEHCEIVEDQGHADGYYFGQVTKYLFRSGSKPSTSGIEDLRKAAWYMNRWVAWSERGKAIWKIQRKPNG